MSTEDRHGLGDPRIPWVVLLDLTWTDPPQASALADRLAGLSREARWPLPLPDAVITGEPRQLLGALTTSSTQALRLGRHEGGLVLAARHEALDGLAMLSAARHLLGEVRSSARGLPPDVAGSGPGALVRRATEVLVRPPARVAPSRSGTGTGDSFASTSVEASPRTADLVHAGARAIAAWNTERGRASRRISVAVGASTLGGNAEDLRDASAFLRLTDVEAMNADEVRAALAAAPVQPGGGGVTAGLLGRALRPAARLAAPRLGSTLLVSHLGTLDADEHLSAAAFYPVTGGGSGLSLGAATLRSTTTITLRARASQHDDDALQQLLERVVAELD
ncbi:MAG: hypothetical protein ACJ72D_12490 [Marmoricola sp.]